MRTIAKTLGMVALAGTIVPPLLFLGGNLAEGPMKFIMLLAAVLWFATAPLWMKGGD